MYCSVISASDQETFQTILKTFDLDKYLKLFQQNGVETMKAFCLLTEADFEKIGLNKGQSRKCILVAKHQACHQLI